MDYSSIDRTGARFGRLVVERDTGERTQSGDIIWACRCDCGKEHIVRAPNLASGNVQSCGCLARELSAARGKARRQPPKPCSVEGCDDTTEKGARGMCGKHAQRVRRYGSPDAITPEEVRRLKSREAQLKNVTSVKPSTYRKLLGRHEHRRVAEEKIGRAIRPDEHVHHIDGNKHNNTPENLEVMHWRDHLALHAAERRRNR